MDAKNAASRSTLLSLPSPSASFPFAFFFGAGTPAPSDILLPQVHGSWRKTVLFRSVLPTPLSDKLPEDRIYSETSGRSHHTHDELLQIPNSMLKVPVLSDDRIMIRDLLVIDITRLCQIFICSVMQNILHIWCSHLVFTQSVQVLCDLL